VRAAPRRRFRALAAPLLAACTLAACGEAVGPGVPQQAGDLSPLQQRLLLRPASSRAAEGRPATRRDLQALRDGFAPGELEMLLRVSNRRSAARGADTLPHCIPLCGSPATGR